MEREWKDRNLGTSIIFRVGAHTKAPIHSLHVAMIFYQRFYMRRSLKGHNYREVAIASLYLALKLYDVHLKLKDLISLYSNVCGIDISKEFVILENVDIKEKLRDAVIFFEEYVLVTITFDMDIRKVL